MPTTIDPAQQVVTLINVFTVEPERQQELVDLLDRATDEVMRHLPGFVSANLHASLDGGQLRPVAQRRRFPGHAGQPRRRRAHERRARSCDRSPAPLCRPVGTPHLTSPDAALSTSSSQTGDEPSRRCDDLPLRRRTAQRPLMPFTRWCSR
jgi:hypothetical protein